MMTTAATTPDKLAFKPMQLGVELPLYTTVLAGWTGPAMMLNTMDYTS